MELSVALVLIAALLLLLGFAIGTRVEERNLHARERELARARRALTDSAHALRVRRP